MNIAESKHILEQVSAIDNRKLSNELVAAWHKIIGHIDYTVAERALLLARRDPAIQYLEPKHIIAKTRDAIIELNDERRKNDFGEESWKSEPIPVCREHGERITQCKPCVRRLMTEARNLYGNQLHQWAIQNIYDDESIVRND